MKGNVFSFRSGLCLLLVAILGLATADTLCAQVNRASITGTVFDTSHGVMAGVEVVARNVDTNVETTSVSNGDGIYVLLNLPPGTYALIFRKVGFKEVVQPSVTLISTQVAGIDATMQVGAASETISVSAQAPLLDSENATFGTNMQGSVVTDLPMSIYNGGRFVENFAVAITPGYSPISNPYTAVVNGGQYFTKDYTVDGTSATASIAGDSFETGPSMEAVQELESQTSGLDAQSAITSGGVMSLNLKSGTNQFHGSLFGYGQNEFLAANTWTNDFNDAPKTKRRAWDYGASVGGPILKNKLFFFGTFERYVQNDFTLGQYSQEVPATPFLGGDFSALLGSQLCTQSDGSVGTGCGSGATPIMVKNNAGQSVPLQAGMIFDPQTGNQFTGNMIPTGRFSKTAQQIVQIFQKNYVPGQPGITNFNNRITLNNSPSQTPNQAVVKLDYDLSPKDKLSGSWIYNNRPRTLVDSGGIWQLGSTDGGPLSAAGFQVVKSDGWRLSESHSFTPTLLNVFNFTYNWYTNGKVPVAGGTNWSQELGFGDTGSDNFPFITFGNPPNGVTARGISFIGTGAGSGPNNLTSQFQGKFAGATILTQDSATWINGRHSFAFGGDFRAYQVNSHTGSGALGFNFTNDTTGQPSANYGPYVGFGFASFLLGDVTTASETTPIDLYGRRKAMSLFAQDSYKLRSNLTLTFGLRWAHTFQYHEKYGRWANFDLQAMDPTLGVPGNLVYANGGGDTFEKKEYWNNFGPQIGFAYSPSNKWVIRGSFGLVYLPPSEPYFSGVPNGFAPGFQGTNQSTAPFNWDSGYPGVFQPGTKGGNVFSLFPVVSVDPHALLPGFSNAFNVGVQYELMKNLRLEVAYVGNRGHHLPDTALAWNEGPSSTFLKVVNANPGINAFNDYVCSPADATKYGVPYPYAGFCAPALAALAPYPQVSTAATSYWFYYNQLYVGLPIGQSSYNSMVLDLLKRPGHGLAMDLNYTYSRTRGDTFTSQQEGNNYYTPVQDFGNISQAANALSNYDQTHVVKGYVAYELPFGRGKRWLSSAGNGLNALVGGWTLNGLVLYTSGQPFQIGVDNPFWPAWGNFYPNIHPTGVYGPFNPNQFQMNAATPLHYFSDSVATSPIPSNGGAVAFGSDPGAISSLRCPGSANENASVLKRFSMGADGRYELSLRVEFYNLFNRHTYSINGCGGLRSIVGHSDFGQVFGVADNPRTGQFGARFTF